MKIRWMAAVLLLLVVAAATGLCAQTASGLLQKPELTLLPAPWSDGEVLEFSKKIAGRDSGAERYSIQTSKANPGHWMIEERNYHPGLQNIWQTDVDKATMKPVSGMSESGVSGKEAILYQGGENAVELAGESQRLSLNGKEWDEADVWAAIRRLPLAPRYESAFLVLTSAGGVTKYHLTVAGIEDIETPAGKFHCYKVQVSGLEWTLWYSTDAPRYLVRRDGKHSSEVLKRISTASEMAKTDQTPGAYRNDELGFSLSLPAGWTVQADDCRPAARCAVRLGSANYFAFVLLSVRPLNRPATAEAIRSDAERNLPSETKIYSAELRPDSWHAWQIDGHPALSWIEDSKDAATGRPKILYRVEVRSPALMATVNVQIDADDFDAFRASFDPVLETLKLK
jgi:hypothetical protein